MNLFNSLTTVQKSLVVAIVAIVIYLLSAGAVFSFVSSRMPVGQSANNGAGANVAESTNPGEVQDEDASIPRTEACPLNGSLKTKNAKEAWEKRRPLAVMIENHTEARPQSGLSFADVVYEAVAEGGITRFMAVYYCIYPEIQVGPVRSARTYFLDWLAEYDALYAHVGGANTPGPANALGQIIDYGVKDLNQFSIGFPTFWRDYQRLGRSVATEHTMYSTTNKLWAEGEKRGWSVVDEKGVRWDKNFVSWKFKDDAAQKGTVTKINVPFWTNQTDYTVEWNYDANCNCYLRVNGGQPHNDLNSNKQVSPKVVIVRYQTESPANDGYEGNAHRLYGNKGTGDALIFQDGQVIEGKWTKANRLAREKFVDSKGVEITLNKGQIWLQTVPVGSKVTY